MRQDPHSSEHLTREGAMLHRAETRVGRPVRGCLLSLALACAIVGLLMGTLFFMLNN